MYKKSHTQFETLHKQEDIQNKDQISLNNNNIDIHIPLTAYIDDKDQVYYTTKFILIIFQYIGDSHKLTFQQVTNIINNIIKESGTTNCFSH